MILDYECKACRSILTWIGNSFQKNKFAGTQTSRTNSSCALNQS